MVPRQRMREGQQWRTGCQGDSHEGPPPPSPSRPPWEVREVGAPLETALAAVFKVVALAAVVLPAVPVPLAAVFRLPCGEDGSLPTLLLSLLVASSGGGMSGGGGGNFDEGPVGGCPVTCPLHPCRPSSSPCPCPCPCPYSSCPCHLLLLQPVR